MNTAQRVIKDQNIIIDTQNDVIMRSRDKIINLIQQIKTQREIIKILEQMNDLQAKEPEISVIVKLGKVIIGVEKDAKNKGNIGPD